MTLQCKLCGHKFEKEDAPECNCNCGCGGSMVLCPNCGYEVRLPKEERPITKEDMDRADNSFLGKVRKALQMGN